MRKRLLIAFVVVILLIQLFQPTKNIHPNADANNIASIYTTPDSVKRTLQTSCYDCHSNNTVYPWYGVLQPAAWWMSSHVNEGKKELNFDEFASYSPRKQYHKLESFIKEIKEDGMPLDSYTWIHKNAILSPGQKQLLMDWAGGIRTQMQQHYPADSLARKK
jgi:hypothetical protein